MRWATAVLVSLIALTFAVGCGDGADQSAGNPKSSSTNATSTDSTGPTADTLSNKFNSVRNGSWEIEVAQHAAPDEVIPENGARAKVGVSVGHLTQLKEATNGDRFANLARQCADTSEDASAFIPIKLTAKNESKVPLQIDVALTPPGLSTDDYDLEPAYAAASTGCWNFVHGEGTQPDAALGDVAPGAEQSREMVLVLQKYISDRFPHGKPTALREWSAALRAELRGKDGSELNVKTRCFIGGSDFQYVDLNLSGPGDASLLPHIWLYQPPEDQYVQPASVHAPSCK